MLMSVSSNPSVRLVMTMAARVPALLGHGTRRSFLAAGALIMATLIVVSLLPTYKGVSVQGPWVTDADTAAMIASPGSQGAVQKESVPHGEVWAETAKKQRKVHILMAATRPDVNLCKTLMTMAMLGYPTPHIMGWGKEYEQETLKGGGSHFEKILGSLKYLNDTERMEQPDFENDLVLMIDAYDIWFQLPLDVLISRYEAILEEENARVRHRMGRAFDIEGINTTVVTAAGKRCGPNSLHTIACFVAPESPLPMDLHRGNTDSVDMGRNTHSSFRTRYLNAGIIMGPVKDLRPLLRRAEAKYHECINRPKAWFDGGDGGTANCYFGSDQSIWVDIWGEQELYREIARRHHRNSWDRFLDRFFKNRPGSDPPPTNIHGTPIYDKLNPPFTHQPFDPTYIPGAPYDAGIAMDYWSLLSHQTVNSLNDARWIRHDWPLHRQTGEIGYWDCPARISMPDDLPGGKLELLGAGVPNTWESVPLYSEVCVDTVPVMIHHNEMDKSLRKELWTKPWWHGRSATLMEIQRQRGSPMLNDGVPLDNGTVLSWEELCPAEYDEELYRGKGPDIAVPPKVSGGSEMKSSDDAHGPPTGSTQAKPGQGEEPTGNGKGEQKPGEDGPSSTDTKDDAIATDKLPAGGGPKDEKLEPDVKSPLETSNDDKLVVGDSPTPEPPKHDQPKLDNQTPSAETPKGDITTLDDRPQLLESSKNDQPVGHDQPLPPNGQSKPEDPIVDSQPSPPPPESPKSDKLTAEDHPSPGSLRDGHASPPIPSEKDKLLFDSRPPPTSPRPNDQKD